MSTTITIKQHDTKITFTDTPTIGGVAMTSGELSGASVSFLLRQTNGPIAFKREATITDDATFEYEPVAEDVAKSGSFHQEWQLVFPSTKILTFPNDGYNTVEILPDLG